MGVEHQLLGLAKIYSDERHTAVRQLHVRRLDRQRESLERDRLVAPVELVGFPWLEAHRHISMGGNSGPFLTPELYEAMHAVVRAVISVPTKLLEQPLRRTALPLRQLGFRLENLRQRIDPNAKLRRRLNVPSVFELGSEASDHLANRRPRHRKRPHDLLDRETLFEIGAPYLADLVHAKHPHPSFPADQAQRKNAHTQVRRGRYWTRKQPFRGSLLQAILDRASARFLVPELLFRYWLILARPNDRQSRTIPLDPSLPAILRQGPVQFRRDKLMAKIGRAVRASLPPRRSICDHAK